jgi:hypothetical protein
MVAPPGTLIDGIWQQIQFQRTGNLPMNSLAGILIRERLRKMNMNSGWTGYISSCLAVVMLGFMLAASLSQFLKQATVRHLENLTLGIWMSWTLVAIITGKDFSWRINRERLRIFPSPGFLRIYALGIGLGFISFPLAAGLCVTQYWVYIRGRLWLGSMLAALAGFLLFALSVKLSASLARSCVLFYVFLTRGKRRLATFVIAAISISTAVSLAVSPHRIPHPGILLGNILAGDACVYSTVWMTVWAALLVAADLMVQRDLDYACMPASLASNRNLTPDFIFCISPAWPSPIFRIGLLGWLRSRSALMLFVWGSCFSFFWTYYSKPNEIGYFFPFVFMNLLFHSSVRANLLGIDRGSAWIYYGFPVPVERSLNSKSLSLSFLQGLMIASLLIAGMLRHGASFSLENWGSILSYSISGILLGEISGFYFSIRHPESIDRTSQYDGSATVGAFVVGATQFLFMLLFMRASAYVKNNLNPASYWMLLLSFPVVSVSGRFLMLNTWVRKTMLAQSETILNKLSWY